MEHRDVRNPCSSCNGTGRSVSGGNCFGCLGSGYNKSTQSNICTRCGGSGQIYTNDTSSSKSRNTGSKQAKPSKARRETANTGKEEQGRAVITLICFILGAVQMYQNSNKNIIAAGIVGFITAYIGWRWYKAIVIIGFIILLIYLFYGHEK